MSVFIAISNPEIKTALVANFQPRVRSKRPLLLIYNPEIKTVAAVFFALLSFYWLVFIYYIGRTQGMFWMQLEIVSLDGSEPENSQRLMRALGTIVSTASFGIGFAWSLVDEEALTFHDNMSKTMIVEVEP